MKIILNPKYEALRDHLKNIEEHFEHSGRDIHSGRNVMRSLKVNGLTICVKCFGPPSFRRKSAINTYENSANAFLLRTIAVR